MFERVASVVLTLTALTGASSVVAQDVQREVIPNTSRGFFMVGWQQLDLDELNDRMAPNGFPSLSEDLVSLGGGFWRWKTRFLIGGEGHVLLGPDRTTSDGTFKTRMSGGHGQLDLGYSIYTADRLTVTPMVGLGGGSVSVDLIERSSPVFDDVVGDPRRGAHLSASGFRIDLSVAVDVRLTRRVKDDDSEDGFAIGLRTGYAVSPGGWDWKLNDETDVPGGPQIGISGPYVRVMLGGWGRDAGADEP